MSTGIPNMDFECLIGYLEARRDQAGFNDAEWEVATTVIDWLKSYVAEMPKQAVQRPTGKRPSGLTWR